MAQTVQSRSPLLVIIDVKALTYKRYIGRQPGVKVRAEAPLTGEEIEMFRTKPELVLPTPEPESA